MREICQLSVLLDTVYENSACGLHVACMWLACGFHEAWVRLVEAMEVASKGSTLLDVMGSYKVTLPNSLNAESPDTCITFCSHSSRLITTAGILKDTCSELLSFLLEQVFTNF
jgi:hypothetical protein